jgi:hypothetical protein
MLKTIFWEGIDAKKGDYHHCRIIRYLERLISVLQQGMMSQTDFTV